MKKHDPRCKGVSGSEEKLWDDVVKYGWHVTGVFDTEDAPAWAYSIGLFHSFEHPEILIFGEEVELMMSMINIIGEQIRSGKRFEVDKKYAGFIEDYDCTFKVVRRVWYREYPLFANSYYGGHAYPLLQCFWPDFDGRFPWEENFSEELVFAQPLLFKKGSGRR